jgi:hypothetical protein
LAEIGNEGCRQGIVNQPANSFTKDGADVALIDLKFENLHEAKKLSEPGESFPMYIRKMKL